MVAADCGAEVARSAGGRKVAGSNPANPTGECRPSSGGTSGYGAAWERASFGMMRPAARIRLTRLVASTRARHGARHAVSTAGGAQGVGQPRNTPPCHLAL